MRPAMVRLSAPDQAMTGWGAGWAGSDVGAGWPCGEVTRGALGSM